MKFDDGNLIARVTFIETRTRLLRLADRIADIDCHAPFSQMTISPDASFCFCFSTQSLLLNESNGSPPLVGSISKVYHTQKTWLLFWDRSSVLIIALRVLVTRGRGLFFRWPLTLRKPPKG